ncbi:MULTISPECIES: iron-containing alcohol dehydrogenase [Nostocales]|nr:iron-containing alcohol dehydrogenase [Tolypothrix bouteillei]KAF3888186.1 iron-containing alcohol dehydrogenase [Tolypothrix bouteillei VB521301]
MSKILTPTSESEQPVTSNTLKKGKTHLSCMELVIKHIRSRPYTSALLVKDINLYGSAAVSRCLKKLKDEGLIDRIWDQRKMCFVYYNVKL